MPAPATRRRPALTRAGTLGLVIGLLALAPSAAQAHDLSKRKALREARAASLRLAGALNGMTLEDGGVISVTDRGWGPCVRRNVHAFRCVIDVAGNVRYPDGRIIDFACAFQIGMRYRSHRSLRLRIGLVGEPQCSEAQRPQPMAAGTGSAAKAPADAAPARALTRRLR